MEIRDFNGSSRFVYGTTRSATGGSGPHVELLSHYCSSLALKKNETFF